MNLIGKFGIDAANDVGGERAAKAGEAAANRESDREQRSTSTPSPAATRGSSTAARSCAPKRVLTRKTCSVAAIRPQTTIRNSR